MITSAPRVGMRGINALTINYDFSGSHTLRSDYGSQETDTSYLNLRNGLNIGPWRLRNYSTLNTSDGRAEYNSISTGYSAILPR